MNARQLVDSELASLGNRIGVPLALDETGAADIELNDDSLALILVPEGADVVLFCIEVTPVPSKERECFLAHLLNLNLRDDQTMGAALSLDDGGEQVILRYTMPGTCLESGMLESMLVALAETAAALRASLQQWACDGKESDEAESDETLDNPPAPGITNFA